MEFRKNNLSNHFFLKDCFFLKSNRKERELSAFFVKPLNFNVRIRQKPGDDRPVFTIVGFFPLHKGTDCKEIVSVKNYNGFQRMEAFVLALEKVNNQVYGSDFFLETILYDTCSDSLAEYVSFHH